MNLLFSLTGLLVVVFLCRTASSVDGPLATVDLSSMLDEVVVNDGLVGLSAFVSTANGTCAIGSAGDRSVLTDDNGAPINLWNSPWHGGSLTKSLTASLAALIVKNSSVPLSWTTTLGDVFPQEALTTAYADVTLLQLLAHRGGFPANPPFLSLFYISLFSGKTLIEQRRQVVFEGLQTAPAAESGVEFLYSNLGYMIAGAMLEEVTGVAWEDLLSRMIFSPLGMKSAYFGCPSTPASPSGHHYVFGLRATEGKEWCDCIQQSLFSLCLCDNPPVFGPAGTVHMQLSDYVRYYQWHLAGELGHDVSGLLTHAEFHHLHTSVGGSIGAAIYEATHESEDRRYGNGWIISTFDIDESKYDVLWHIGTSSTWFAFVAIDPSRNRVYFIATNSAKTKSGKDVMGAFLTLLDRMQSLDFNETKCPSIDALDSGRDPGSHSSCPELVYGSNGGARRTSNLLRHD